MTFPQARNDNIFINDLNMNAIYEQARALDDPIDDGGDEDNDD
jgi:hypothetical protein